MSRKRRAEPELASSEAAERQRIDVWLWHARFYKTRSLAAKLCEAGAVEIAGVEVQRASQLVRVGDLVRLVQGSHRVSVAVLGMAERRGPAAEAAALYRQIGPRLRIEKADPSWQAILSLEEVAKVGDQEG